MSIAINVTLFTIAIMIVVMVLGSLIECLYQKLYGNALDKSSRWRTLYGIAGRLLLVLATVCFLSVLFRKYVSSDDDKLIAFCGITTITLLLFQSSLLSDIGRMIAF